MVSIGKVFIDASIGSELFWTDRKQGGRLYHFLNVGMYDMSHISEGCKCISITIPFFTFKVGVTR